MNKLTQSFILILFAFTSLVLSSQANADYFIIANNSVGINTINKSEVKSIFLGRKKLWANGSVISPCYLSPNHKITQQFFNAVIKKDHASFVRYWNKKLFSGSGNPPVISDSPDELLVYVKRKKGGICFSSHQPEKLPDNVSFISLIN